MEALNNFETMTITKNTIHNKIKEIKKIGKPKQNHLIHLCGAGEPNVTQMMEHIKK